MASRKQRNIYKSHQKNFQTAPLEYLSWEQMQTIHSTSLKILEQVGCIIYHAEAIDMLVAAGARVEQDKRVFIPSIVVEEAIRTAPYSVTIYNRQGQPAMLLEENNVYYGTGSDCPNLLDNETGERRPFLYKDVEESIRLVDALPNIDFTMSNGLAADIDQDTQYQHKYALMLRNTAKPQVVTAGDKASLADIIEMAAAVAGGREALTQKPFFVLYDEPTSPLVHSGEALDKLLLMAELALPINYSPGMMAGATGPVTIAGSMALANAEILAGLALHQLKNPGAPFIFGAGMSPMDLNSMQPTYSAPEAMMAQAGLCQMGRVLYHLPTWGFGGCSASKLADEQAVNEASKYIMMAAWMGTNLVHDVGYIEFGLTYSYNLLVICNEIIGQVRRMMEGITVDEEHLAFDTIQRLGPGKSFLSDEHTMQYFRENWRPDITNRQIYAKWKEKGATTLGQRARRKIQEILATHRPEPLAPDVEQQIGAILACLKR